MNSVKHHRSVAVLLLAIAIVLIMTSSCIFPGPHYVTDPAAKTPGYRLFTSRVEGFRISFEYPDTWQRLSTERYDTFRVVEMYVGETATIGVTSDVKASDGGEFENPSARIQYELREPLPPEFHILGRGKASLGQVEGEEVTYSYRFIHDLDPHLPPGTVIDRITIARILAVEHKSRIYNISLAASADKYESIKDGFEHLIVTFRFLD